MKIRLMLLRAAASGVCAALDDELMAMVQGKADSDATL